MVSTNPNDPNFGLEMDPGSPNFGLSDDIPTEHGQVVTPDDAQPDEHDYLYFKTGKTRSQRESDNALFRQAMQTPAISPETATRGFSALGEIGGDLEQDPVSQGISETLGSAASGMTSGEGVASLPEYMFPATAAFHAAESAQEIPKQIQDVVDSAQGGTPKEVAANTTKALLNILMTGGVMHGAVEGPLAPKYYDQPWKAPLLPRYYPEGASSQLPPRIGIPPPIPPQYQGMFTAPGLESGWQMGPQGEHVPVGQPEGRPGTAPVPPFFETMKGISPTPGVREMPKSMALGPVQPNFVMRPSAPETAPAPSIEETLQKTEPKVDPNLDTHAQTRAILAKRDEVLAEIEQLRPLVENARQLTGGRGEAGLEARWKELNDWLANKKANPVVHAPPPPRTGAFSETARLPGAGVPVGPSMGEAPLAAQPSSEVRTNIPSETARLPGEAQFPRGGPANEPGGTQGASEEPGRVKTAGTSEEAAKYGGPAAAREALRQQVRRDQAARIKRRIQNDGGFVSKVTMEDIRNLGKEIYEYGMDFAKWSAEMIRHVGDVVKEHLQKIWEGIQATAPYRAWEDITGGRLRKPLDLSKPENFELVDRVVPAEIRRPSERGSVGRTGGPRKEYVSVDSNGDRHTGEWDPDLRVVPKFLATAPKEEVNLFRTKDILGTGADPKTVKGEKYGVTTYISYLQAEKGSGVVNMCVFATEKCTEACLGKGGNGRYDHVVQGRINKTKFFAYDPVTYLRQLDGEIVKAKAKAAKTGNVLAIRLNGTSDVLWEKSGLFERHPDTQFYDYTKYPQTLRKNLPPNYHLTYSYTGTSASEAFSKTWNDHGVNTAVVFRDGMPAKFLGRDVIDGDVSDLRFLDPPNVIVGLHAKGKLLSRDKATGKYIETNEFVYDTPPGDVAIPYFNPVQKANILKGEFLGEEALGAMKDLAPKADDLKWKRGNPDLGLNEPGATPELSPIQAFRERLKARRVAIRGEGRQLSALGFDPEDTALQAAIGGTYIAEGVTDFAKWSAAMVKEFGPDIEPHLTNLWKSANAAHQQFQQTGQYTSAPQTPSTQDAPIGVRNETLRAREDAGLSTAPPPGRGVTWQDSVNRGNKALDAGADPYKIISDFQKDSLIGHPRLDPVRAWLERLQRANAEAHGALEADPTNPTLAAEALRTQALENEFVAAYQPMKTEWGRSGTGMHEERGITDSDLLSQKTAEQTMRDHLDRELNDSDKARAADAVKRTRKANADTEAAFTEALDHAEKAAKAPPMTPEQMKTHFAERIKQLTPC